MNIDTVLNFVSCLAAVATGASAVVALVHYLRHWRDDEVKLAVELNHSETCVDGDGCALWSGRVRITNVGKVPVTIVGFEFVDDSLAEGFELNEGVHPEIFLYEGTSAEAWAFAKAKKPDIPVPDRFSVRCRWAKAKDDCNGCFAVDAAKTGTAR